jgi:two-component system, NtrC family, nitrogen regulation sensor histidine kinase NtrY
MVDAAAGMIDRAEQEAPAARTSGRRRHPRWLRRLAIASERGRIIPLIEVAVVVLLIATVTATYFIVTSRENTEALLSPPAVAALLVANLVPSMAMMVLLARRFARKRAARMPLGGRGRLHVRLVALFSLAASIPTLLVVIFASLLLQSGINFWFSDQAKDVFANAEDVAETYRSEQLADVRAEMEAMGVDVVNWINTSGVDHPLFYEYMLDQTGRRKLIETALLTINSEGAIQMQGGVNLYDRPLESRFPAADLLAMQAGEVKVKFDIADRIEAVVRLDPEARIYVYGARDATQLSRIAGAAEGAAGGFQSVLERSRAYQFQFNAALFIVSLLIVALAIWIALRLADRWVRPVGELADAARRVTAGELSARVPGSRARDEIATLGQAFNRMTTRLEAQTGALVGANRQLENRRAFIEAVLSGVTAGIISVDRDRRVQLINPSAEGLLRTSETKVVGQRLAELAPELDRHLDAEEGEDIVQISRDGEVHTLAVKRVKADGGHILTFDDITEQLLDQRRAAWSDVARRIAHEIKNPLTPIQLAAERLQRRYGQEVQSDPATFERLTGTIVRQVGDLRRMVDEFSSFARMPKPVFRKEAVAEVARQALFLHEVAHPDIRFALDAPEPAPSLICDRRLLGQALTNLVKNAVEAIQQRREEGVERAGEDRVEIAIREQERRLTIEVIDTGIGLPADRKRLTEPYMTTRAKGTGLGLAIVKKIVEDHFGQIGFEDGEGGGTRVILTFDLDLLARTHAGGPRAIEEHPANG